MNLSNSLKVWDEVNRLWSNRSVALLYALFEGARVSEESQESAGDAEGVREVSGAPAPVKRLMSRTYMLRWDLDADSIYVRRSTKLLDTDPDRRVFEGEKVKGILRDGWLKLDKGGYLPEELYGFRMLHEVAWRTVVLPNPRSLVPKESRHAVDTPDEIVETLENTADEIVKTKALSSRLTPKQPSVPPPPGLLHADCCVSSSSRQGPEAPPVSQVMAAAAVSEESQGLRSPVKKRPRLQSPVHKTRVKVSKEAQGVDTSKASQEDKAHVVEKWEKGKDERWIKGDWLCQRCGNHNFLWKGFHQPEGTLHLSLIHI